MTTRFLFVCKGLQNRDYPQADYLSTALQATLGVRVADLDIKGLEGKIVGEKLRTARIAAVREQTVQPGE